MTSSEGLRKRYAETATRWALMYPLGNWPCLGYVGGGDARNQLDAIARDIAAAWGSDIADKLLAVRDTELERLRAAVAEALTALEGAETSCRYHGEDPPEAPAWHGGCESCRQPTRVREALAAIRALDGGE